MPNAAPNRANGSPGVASNINRLPNPPANRIIAGIHSRRRGRGGPSCPVMRPPKPNADSIATRSIVTEEQFIGSAIPDTFRHLELASPLNSCVVSGARGGAAAFGPVGVEELAAGLVRAFVGVSAEVIAQGLPSECPLCPRLPVSLLPVRLGFFHPLLNASIE